MESQSIVTPVTSPQNREKRNGKRKIKKRSQDKRKVNAAKRSKDEEQSASTKELLTQSDEDERLCLLNYHFVPKPNSGIETTYPKHFNVTEYQQLSTTLDQRKYRDSKDLRYRHQNNAEASEQLSDERLCYKQLRGEKCNAATCLFKHEFRLPRRLRLCKEWRKGYCADGQFCSYLHSEFPCRYHYLGLKSIRHESSVCRFSHGGPLPKEFEEIFLDSIDSVKMPMFREMYHNRMIELGAKAGNSTNVHRKTESISSHQTDDQEKIGESSVPPVEAEIGNPLKGAVNDGVNEIDEDVVKEHQSDAVAEHKGTVRYENRQEDAESSDESSLQIDELD